MNLVVGTMHGSGVNLGGSRMAFAASRIAPVATSACGWTVRPCVHINTPGSVCSGGKTTTTTTMCSGGKPCNHGSGKCSTSAPAATRVALATRQEPLRGRPGGGPCECRNRHAPAGTATHSRTIAPTPTGTATRKPTPTRTRTPKPTTPGQTNADYNVSPIYSSSSVYARSVYGRDYPAFVGWLDERRPDVEATLAALNCRKGRASSHSIRRPRDMN
jgi:hypothetical protein